MNGVHKVSSCPSFNWSTKIKVCYNEAPREVKKYKQVNQYLLLKKLGEGSYSKVYLGLDEDAGKYYAIKRIQKKVLIKSNCGLSQLEFEVEVMRKFEHDNIIKLREVIYVSNEETFYLVLDYSNCGNLGHLLKSGTKFNEEQIQNIFSQLVEGLSYIHERSIVHQDIKPSNLLLKSDGKVIITDFGIGRSSDKSAKVLGTPAYQAPEVISETKNNIEEEHNQKLNSAQEDIWSLGVTLYELSFNKLPFEGDNLFEIVHSISNTDLSESPQPCDSSLWDLIKKMLTVDPKKRITLSEIQRHPYYVNASRDKNVASNVKPISIPTIEKESKITRVEGTIFEESFEIFETQIKNHYEDKSILVGR